MAALTRITFFFQNIRDAGWTETHFLAAGTDLETIIANAQVLVQNRVRLLGGGASITYVRASDDATQGDSLIYVPPGNTGSGGGQGAGDADYAGQAILVRLQSTKPPYKTRGQIFLRGVPDSWIIDNGVVNYGSSYSTQIGNWIKALQAANCGLRSITNANPQPIQGMVQNAANGIITITTQGAHLATQVPPGNIINITKLHGFKGIRGRHSVFTVVSPTVLTIRSNTFMPPYLGSGVLSNVTANFAAIDTFQTIGVTHRKAGRSFDSPHGRLAVR